MWWHEPTRHTPDGEGFWSVATYDGVLAVLNDPVTYSSETGGDRPYGGTIIQDLPVAGVVLNMMDDPRHARIRRLVTRGLTPTAVRALARLEIRVALEEVLRTVASFELAGPPVWTPQQSPHRHPAPAAAAPAARAARLTAEGFGLPGYPRHERAVTLEHRQLHVAWRRLHVGARAEDHRRAVGGIPAAPWADTLV